MTVEDLKGNSSFDLEQFVYRFRFFFFFLFLSFVLIILGVNYFRQKEISSDQVEVLDDGRSVQNGPEIVVEIAGAVQTPGVYKLSAGSRIEDLLIAAGGLAGDADRSWMDKSLNRAAKLTDGQKIYLPFLGEQTNSGSAKNNAGYQTASSVLGSEKGTLIDINSASLSELDTLPGIGPVYGQSIIDHRPYSKTEELRTKNVLTPSVYEKVKDLVSVN
jgi:competence protein ComEA